MDVFNTAPALLPAAAWLAGLFWVFAAGRPPIHLAALGLALAIAWSGRRGALALAAFFAALLAASAQVGDGDSLAALAGRHVEVNGRALGHADGEGERMFLLETESLQAGRFFPVKTDLLVVLGREDSSAELEVGWGDRLALRGQLQAPAAARNGAVGWPGLYRLKVKSEKLAEIRGKGRRLDRLAAWLRGRAEKAAAAWPADESSAAFWRCLLLGDRSRLPDSWARSLNAVGLGHALSVSGFHISLFFVIAWGATSFFPPRLRGLRLLLVFLLLAAYLLLVGPRPAALRAGIMGLAVLAALIFERPSMALNSLAVAAVLLTADRPQLVLDLSFRLTVLATFGLAVAALALPAPAPPWRRVLAAGFGAELATLPLLLPRTAMWHPLGFLFNALAGPWLGALTVIGFGYLAAAEIAPSLAAPLAHLFAAGCAPFAWLEWLLPSPLASLPIAHPGWVGWLAPAAFLALVAAPRPARWVLLLGLLLLCRGSALLPEKRLEVAFIDVGQGDATLLVDGRQSLLVDGGGWRRGDPAARMLIPALVGLGVTRLSAVALSHGDLDHCGGLAALASYWPLGELWASAATAEAGCGREVKESAPRFRPLAAGDRLRFGRWSIEVLWPPPESRERGNEGSLVLRASAGGKSLLLTGDIEKLAERRLHAAAADSAASLEAEVLKVAHHGSRSSSGAAFLADVGARWAIVSAGEGNRFGHPAPEVLERLAAGGACRILRTDRQGLIRMHWPQAGRPLILELGGMPAAPYKMPHRMPR